MRRTGNTMLAALLALLMSAVVLAGGTSPAWAAGGPVEELAFFFRILFAGGPSSYASAFELGTDAKQEHTLSVTMAISTSSGDLMTLKVGQQFDNAALQIFDQTFTLLATIRLSPVQVTAVRSSGELKALVLNILSGKTVAVSFP